MLQKSINIWFYWFLPHHSSAVATSRSMTLRCLEEWTGEYNASLIEILKLHTQIFWNRLSSCRDLFFDLFFLLITNLRSNLEAVPRILETQSSLDLFFAKSHNRQIRSPSLLAIFLCLIFCFFFVSPFMWLFLWRYAADILFMACIYVPVFLFGRFSVRSAAAAVNIVLFSADRFLRCDL